MKLETSQLILRDWIEKDFQDYEYWMSPNKLWQTLDGPYYGLPSREELFIKIDKLRSKIRRGCFEIPRSRFVIALKKNNQFIGTVNSYWQSMETNWLSVGIIIFDENNWSKGYASQALSLWLDYLFTNHPKIVRLDMRTWSGNLGLIGLAQKLGFKKEACFRNARIVNDKFYDGLGFGILREEWDSSKFLNH